MSKNEVELFADPPLWFKVIGQLLCLGAVQLCCKRQLARWKAHKEAAPPLTITKEDAEPPKPILKTRWEMWRSMAISLSMIIVPILGLSGVLKKGDFTSQLIIDIVWTCLMLHIFSGAFADALYGIFPRQRYLRKVRGWGIYQKLWEFEVTSRGSEAGFRWSNPFVNKCAGFACAAIYLSSSYFDRQQFIPIAAAAQIMSALVSSYAVKYRMRYMVLAQAAVLAAFTIPAIWIYLAGPSNTIAAPPTDSAKVSPPKPSPWLLNLVCLFPYTVAIAIPGAFMVVNMRYEYGRLAPPALPSAPGEAVLIDHKADLPILPLHQLSMYGFIACFAAIDALQFFGRTTGTNHWVDSFFIVCLAIPVTVGGSALFTLCRGDFQDWWNYSETYRPEIDFSAVTEVDSDGKEVQLGEKRPVTP